MNFKYSAGLREKYKNYKYCVIKECKSNSLITPEKLFIKVPSNINARNAWFQLAEQDPSSISINSAVYFCEDHFELENDMENYMQYKLLGSVKKIRIKNGCLPSKFECRVNRKRKLMSPQEPEYAYSKKNQIETVVSNSSFDQEVAVIHETLPTCANTEKIDQEVQAQPVYQHASSQVFKYCSDKNIQTAVNKHYRSKQVQFNVTMKDAGSSALILGVNKSTLTSPVHISQEPSVSGQVFVGRPRKRLLFTEDIDSDVSYVPSQTGSSLEYSPSKQSSGSTSDCYHQKKIPDPQVSRMNTITKIKLKPRLYIGIPKEIYFIVNIISNYTNSPEYKILLCLMKIRLNRTFTQLGDDFGISFSQASKIFSSEIPKIVSVMSPFIKKFTKDSIKKNLPISFRYKYSKVNFIIDCLEIEIQKPSKAVHQALTWSEYKKANTLKYLISCTPDGMINFVSNGYGGRISDVNLVEHCKYLDNLEPGSFIFADRGFKHIEAYCYKKNIKLLRPPSVASGNKLTKEEARLTKEVASLRIHVERVIRRVREFSLLKPHSVVNSNMIGLLDHSFKVACALINLQDSLIK